MPFGAVVTRRQLRRFTAGVLLMWIASDWPIHDISEEYLYSMHMLQHLMISYFVPPLLLLATPKWLFDAVFGTGRGFRVIKFLSRAPVAGLLFNVMVMVAHIPDVVNRSVSNGPALQPAYLPRAHCTVDVDASLRSREIISLAVRRNDDLSLFDVGSSDSACGVAYLC